MTANERLVFAQAGVFLGGWSLEAADAVCVTTADAVCVTTAEALTVVADALARLKGSARVR